MIPHSIIEFPRVRICEFSHTRYRRVLERGIYSALGHNCQRAAE